MGLRREEVELAVVGTMGHAKRQQRKTRARWLRANTDETTGQQRKS